VQFILEQRKFLSGPFSSQPRPGSVVGEEEELVVLETLRDDVLPHCGDSCALDCVRRFVSVVYHCSLLQHKRPLANAGTNTLFHLCQRVLKDDASPNHRVGVVTLPVLLARCQTVLSQYIIDDRSTGEAPLPRHRHDEVMFFLTELRNSQLEPQLFEQHDAKDCPLRILCPPAYRKRGLVVRLYPTLIEFLTCNDASLRRPLLDLLRLTAHELGLDPSSPSPSHPSVPNGCR